MQRGNFSFERLHKGEIPGLDAAPNEVLTLAYVLIPRPGQRYALEFEPMGRMAAETFEALLAMLVLTDGGQEMLADSVDLKRLNVEMEGLGLQFHSRPS